MPAYSIATVARMTGISIETLRAWERRYELVTPQRDATGVRRYDDRDVARLELARAATALGHPIRWVAKHSDDELRAMVGAPHAAADGVALDPTVRAVLGHLGRYEIVEAERALNTAALLLAPDDFVLRVLAPLMRTVGALWERAELSVAQEHLASQLVRDLVARLVGARTVRDACTMLFCTPPGELHELGIDLAAALTAAHGLRPCVLGASLPASDVAAATRSLRPRAVVIGTTLCVDPAMLARYLGELSATLPPKTELWVGGEGTRRAEAWPSRPRSVPRLETFASLIAGLAP
ncbi:MAG TPA: MerR family transcriptional regulator [Candidatus Baltobacteraceae bacterium]|nr:MerR family transcriptional regulator [Candidatus Baltobacteraceae bacterium]